MRVFLLTLCLFYSSTAFCQQTAGGEAAKWADSVYQSLSNDQRIAQLMVVRLSSIDMKTKQVTFFDQQVAELVKNYNIGGICVFQGSPVKQAGIINNLQAMAKTPILMCMDAEWGVGMRILDSVLPLPKQMMLGAMKDASIVYKYGKVVADQCKRLGLHVNYAPVIDVNNNPDNPVINDRSFGEDKYKVALFGTQYMRGMQDNGVMACAKHFPGHGDVSVDSHVDLPIINKSIAQLDSLELYPFRQLFAAGIESAMVAHLYIPAIDSTANRATSLSKNNVTGLLRNQLHFEGLTFTDALEMQGVKKFFPDGEASVQSLIAGNDMLCLPGDVPIAIQKINEAIEKGTLSRADIELHCKKVLVAKYQYAMGQRNMIVTENLTTDLNKEVPAMRRLVAENAITLLSGKDSVFFPLPANGNDSTKEVAYVGIGLTADNAFARRMRNDYGADVFYVDYAKKNADSLSILVDKIVRGYHKVIIGIHNTNRPPLNNFGISADAVTLVNVLQQRAKTMTFLFANPYAAKNWCAARNLVVCYEDDSIVQHTAIDMLQGKLPYKGVLPVSVCDQYRYGFGITASAGSMKMSSPFLHEVDSNRLANIDSIVNDAIAKKAMPGCVVLVAKDGDIIFRKAYGHYTYDQTEAVKENSVYDLASVTKVAATTLAIMKLAENGQIDIHKKLSDYLPWVKGSNKEDILIEKILLHEAGLVPYIPFFKETLDAEGKPLNNIYAGHSSKAFPGRVANNLYINNYWIDSMYRKILKSPVGPPAKYVYSDIDFILLGKLVETVSGKRLDEYVRTEFYEPMGLESIGYSPLTRFPINQIAPTENEKTFRSQLLRGDVHDPGAAMFGSPTGHAGLFSDATDMAAILQMLLNGGSYNGNQYLKKETIDLFTAYHSNISRRGYGFDKPEKDNATRPEPYPAKSASALTFGHTGYTGTCVWADPQSKLIFVFLSNRVYPNGSELLLKMNIRPKIFETIYQSLTGKHS